MRYRALGKTGLTVSEVGFGAWGIGGTNNGAISYGPTDDQESIRALQRAFDKGITFYDTADLYGYGHSESLIGRVFQSRRDKIVIATKAGYIDQKEHRQDFSAPRLRRALEESLRRLRTDYVDLYQLHSIPLDSLVADESIIRVLELFRTEGKIRAFGMSARSPQEGLGAVRRFAFGVVQANFNLIDHRAIESGLIHFCESHTIGLIARTPLCFGFLSGAYSETDTFGPGDHRSSWPPEQIRLWAHAGALFATTATKRNATTSQLALQFCLAFHGVSCVIPGMLRVSEVDENAATSDLEVLTPDERTALQNICSQHQFFLGKPARVK